MIWVKNVGHGLTQEEFSVADQVIEAHGFDPVLAYLTDTFLCPKTAKITWRDFSFWAQNYDLTRRTIDAWRRVSKIKVKVAAADTQAAKNPDLQTGQDALKWCEDCKDTHAKGKHTKHADVPCVCGDPRGDGHDGFCVAEA